MKVFQIMKKLFLLMFISMNLQADPNIKTCFTPQDECTNNIINSIKDANHTILVQAYSFTSLPIANALVEAETRGIQVKIIMDKSNFEKVVICENLFKTNNIPLWNDYKPDIAHNKIIIIDKDKVITGSFNFTNAAQFRNSENVIFIDDIETTKAYIQNWNYRQSQSKRIES
jgi:phosphatidylserine/phosphatidylglycerophosphate/cardiolipin synthase-like enzyme